MKDWLATLAPRERLVLGAGAVAAAVILLWIGVWRPLTGGTAGLGAAVAEKRALVADLQRAAAISQAGAQASRAAGATQTLVVLVDRTAQAGGLASSFTGTRPDGRDDINVSFQNAAFDAIVDWLLLLERDHGVTVESASFNEAGRKGLVSGQIMLTRGG